MQGRRVVGLVCVSSVLAIVASTGGAAGASAPAAHQRPGKLTVGVEVLRFSGAGRALSARGQVTAVLTDNSGHRTVIAQPVALTASTGGSCRVLHLFLDQLNLQLLGLTAHLDRVTLDITGQPGGGVLGSLFCRLARAKVASVASVRALNASLRRHPQQALRFSASLQPQARTAAAPTCPVLDLIVGPLNLNLLGLEVDLNKVHLNVYATPGQGKLGDTFCSLAS